MLVPVHIKPYLVPFFFKEMEGTEARYLNKRVKAVKIIRASALGNIIRTLLAKSDLPSRFEKISIFLQIQESVKKEYKGTIFKTASGNNSFLKVPEEVNEIINDLLEEYFRIGFIYYMEGYLHANPKGKIRPAIEEFMNIYDLYDFGFTSQSFRVLYYREKNKKQKLTRIQYRPSNKCGKIFM